jgi:Cu2+-exporting ATPase
VVEDIHEIPGFGLRGVWQGQEVALRRPDSAGTMAVALALADRPLRLITFADTLRPDSREALVRLKSLGIECSILSGDNSGAVAEVARATGLTAQSNATPGDKRDAIVRLQKAGRRVLMVGDGLNDGPALAAANASIAPGTASDVGRQAADVVFLGDSLLALPRAVLAARRTLHVVRQNFVLAIGYNALAVPLAMAGMITPLLAAIAMSTSSLIVIVNSLRLTGAVR